MSASADPGVLILGIGNPLRGDDGLGWAAIERLSQDQRCQAYEIRAVHQLTPELALPISQARLVVLIDASITGEPGEIAVHTVIARKQAGAIGTHHAQPEELAWLAATIYGRCPPIVVVSMTGADFRLSEQLSPLVSRRLPLLCARIEELCATR